MTITYLLPLYAIFWLLYCSYRNIRIILTLIFLSIIYVSRDIVAAPDAKVYIHFFLSNYDISISYLNSNRGLVLFTKLISLFDILPGKVTYHLSTLFFPLSFLFLNLSSVFSFVGLYLISTEYFLILSFNAMRQGFAGALLLVILFKISNMKSFNEIRFYNKLLIVLGLLWSILLHSSSIYIIFVVCLRLLYPLLSQSILTLAKKVTLNKLFLKTFIVLVAVFIALVSLKTTFLSQMLDYVGRNEYYGSGVIGSIYRFVSALSIYFLVRRDANNLKNSLQFIIPETILIGLLVMFLMAPFSLQLVIRESYYCYIPALLLLINFSNLKTLSRYSPFVLLFNGFITYSSNATLSMIF